MRPFLATIMKRLEVTREQNAHEALQPHQPGVMAWISMITKDLIPGSGANSFAIMSAQGLGTGEVAPLVPG